MIRASRIKVSARIADQRTVGRVWEVCLVTGDQIAACIPGKEHAGRIWISKANINVTGGASSAGPWRIAS